MLEQFFISSPIGFLKVCVMKGKLYSISRWDPKKSSRLQTKKHQRILDQNISYIYDENSKNGTQYKKCSFIARRIKTQLKKYFEGKVKQFDIPLWMRGTDFQKKTWESLKSIPFGTTITYGQLAKKLKNDRASRAIGNCCAKNPFLIVVPCHRVLSKKGLGGFALGLKVKKQLLFLEQNE